MRNWFSFSLIGILSFFLGAIVVWVVYARSAGTAIKPIRSEATVSASIELEAPNRSIVDSEAAPDAAQTGIRKIDFENFTYRLSCGSADRKSLVTARDGFYWGPKPPIKGSNVYLNVYEITYGDLNNDGKEEAVVLYSCGSGASYVYFWGFIYGMQRDRPVLLAEIEGGDNHNGGFEDVTIRDQRLIVQRFQSGSPCCQDAVETTTYRLKGNRLVQMGDTTSRNTP